MSRIVAACTSGIAAWKMQSPAWHVPLTVRLTARHAGVEQLAVVGEALVAQRVELVHGDDVRRQPGQIGSARRGTATPAGFVALSPSGS